MLDTLCASSEGERKERSVDRPDGSPMDPVAPPIYLSVYLQRDHSAKSLKSYRSHLALHLHPSQNECRGLPAGPRLRAGLGDRLDRRGRGKWTDQCQYVMSPDVKMQ